MSFSTGAGEVGQGIGNFLGPVFNSLGTNTTTTQTTTQKPSSNTTLVIVVVVVLVISVAIWFYKRKQTA